MNPPCKITYYGVNGPMIRYGKVMGYDPVLDLLRVKYDAGMEVDVRRENVEVLHMQEPARIPKAWAEVLEHKQRRDLVFVQ